MHKKLTVLLLSIIFLLTTSCASGMENLPDIFLKGDKRMAEETMQKVLDAITAEDKEALKALFSTNALNEAEDMDGAMDALFEFIQGEVEPWDDAILGTNGKFDEGYAQKQFVFFNTVTINEQEYFFFLLEYPIDTFNPNNVGLYTLFVMDSKNEESFGYWTDHVYPGIEVWEPPADSES